MSGYNDWSWRPDRATKEALKKGYRSAAINKLKPTQKKRASRPKYDREEMAEIAAAYKASKYL
jgi:hypothetical protein